MRKRCTRQHFIEYLSYNFVERQCLMARCLWQRYYYDYGIDGFVLPVNAADEVGEKFLDIQVKATEELRQLKDNSRYVFDFTKNDIEDWLNSSVLILLVIYEAKYDRAFFIDVAEYFREKRYLLSKANKFVRLHFSKTNEFSQFALNQYKLQQ